MDKTIAWLLGEDNPSVRYFTLKHLLERSEDDPQVQAARRAIVHSAPVRAILAAQNPEGYWAKPGAGWAPYCTSTIWQILFLAELGADRANQQVRLGCEYLMEHAQAKHGGLSAAPNAAPSGAVHCHNGNMIWALVMLGYDQDERVQRAVEWLAGAITGDSFDWWYASSVPGPGLRCAQNMKQPCAWGAVKALRALTTLPADWRTTSVCKATDRTAGFLLSYDLAKADYPHTERVSGNWFRFGFPLSYTSDILEALLALSQAGYGHDLRLRNAMALVSSKRDRDQRWVMERSLNSKMWADVEMRNQPSKWLTLRALVVLKAGS
ncbi:MAG: nitrogen fixation protein NifH [Anaerolineae bacterium]